jgi:hypothetical protein
LAGVIGIGGGMTKYASIGGLVAGREDAPATLARVWSVPEADCTSESTGPEAMGTNWGGEEEDWGFLRYCVCRGKRGRMGSSVS